MNKQQALSQSQAPVRPPPVLSAPSAPSNAFVASEVDALGEDTGLLEAAAGLAPKEHAVGEVPGCTCFVCNGGEQEDDAGAAAELEALLDDSGGEDDDGEAEATPTATTDALEQKVSIGKSGSFPKTLGTTTTSWTQVAPAFDIETREEDKGIFYPAEYYASVVSKGSASPPSVVAVATAAGDYKEGQISVPTSDGTTYTFDKIYKVSANDQATIVAGEQEHVDDSMQAYAQTLLKAQSTINVCGVADYLSTDSEEDAYAKAKSDFNKRIGHSKLQVTDFPSVMKPVWSMLFMAIVRYTPDRDDLGWHTYKWKLVDGSMDLDAKTVAYEIDWGGTSIGKVGSAAHVANILNKVAAP